MTTNRDGTFGFMADSGRYLARCSNCAPKANIANMNFAFVHEILTYSRVHDERRSSFADRFNTYITAYLRMLKKFGARCLSAEEYESLTRQKLKEYYRFLGKSLINRREREFWDYHRKELKELGYPFSLFKLGASSTRALLSKVFGRLWA